MQVRLMAVVACGLLLLGGCKSKDADKPIRLHGVVEAMDLATGIVTMTWYNEKLGKEQTNGARIAENVRVFVDGQAAKPQDVKIGDVVDVEVFKEGTEYFVSRVEVKRKALRRPARSTPEAVESSEGQ